MSDGLLRIGTTTKFVDAVCPSAPMDSPLSGYGESMGFENGGQAAVGSFGQARRFDFNFGALTPLELEPYKRLRHGSYGAGRIHFAHPQARRVNLFSPQWAEPGLLEVGDWPDIYDSAPSFSNVSANSYDQPLRKATFTITNTNVAPTSSAGKFIIPIDPDATLHLGVSGAATGTAVVRVVAHNIAAGSSAATSLTLLTDTASTRLNASFAGSSYDYVEIYFMRTSGATSTLVVTSMLAQLWPTGDTPTLTGNHRHGEGQTGCMFAGDVWSERDLTASDDVMLKAAGFTLLEVGAWES
jgi:hypothetical protein